MRDTDRLDDLLTRLRLTAIRDQLDSLLDEAGRAQMTLREALLFLAEREVARRDTRRIQMGMKLARFPCVRTLEGFDFDAQPSIDPGQIRDLATGRWSVTVRPCCCSARRAWAKRTWRWRSGAKRSIGATRCCSARRRR